MIFYLAKMLHNYKRATGNVDAVLCVAKGDKDVFKF